LHDIARSSRTYGVAGFFVIHPIQDQRDFATRVIDHWQAGYGRQFDSRRREALDLIRVVTDLDEAIVEIEQKEGARPTIVYTSARALTETERPGEAPPAIVNAAPARHHPPTLPPGVGIEASPAPVSDQPSARSAASVEMAAMTPAESSQESGHTAPRAARLSYAELRARLERNDTPPVLLLFGTGFGMAPAVLERADLALPPVFGPGAYNHLSVRAAAGIILDRLRGH
jgi:hypothetical protein